MDDGFRKSEAKRVAKVQTQDRADFVAEMNGSENGRAERYGLRSKHRQEEIRKEREKRSLSEALRISTAYAKLYNSTLQLLHDTRDAVYEAQVLVSAQLEQAEKALAEILARANKTPDGVSVFLAADGSAYDERGQKLDDDTLEGMVFVDGASSWEDYQQRRADLEAKQESFDRMSAHSLRIDEIQERMEDEDNPPSMEELEALNKEVEKIRLEAYTVLGKSIEEPTIQQKAEALPALDFGDFTR